MTAEQDGTWYGLVVPYRGHLKEPIKPGQTLIIQGLTTKEAQRFTINLHNKSADFSGNDIPLHISIRFDESKAVFNTFSSGQWGKEEKKKLPFKRGDNFDIRARAHDNKFDVFINRKPFLEYTYRLPLNEITHFSVEGDLFLSKIHWSGKYYAVPHETGIPSGFTPGKRLLIFGQVEKKAKRFNINLLHKSGDIALHFNPRFDEKVIVRNALTLGAWGKEEREGKNVFEKGALFDLFIDNTEESFKIFINNQYYADFVHRLGAHEIHGLQIQGDVDISGIQMETLSENHVNNEPKPQVDEPEISANTDVVAQINDKDEHAPEVQMEGLLTRSMETFGHGFDQLPFHSLFGHIENESDAVDFHRFFSRGFGQRHQELFDISNHEFRHIDPKSGKIHGCIKGCKLFNFGGQDNSLNDFGKKYLEHIVSGKCKRKVHPFVPYHPCPTQPKEVEDKSPLPEESAPKPAPAAPPAPTKKEPAVPPAPAKKEPAAPAPAKKEPAAPAPTPKKAPEPVLVVDSPYIQKRKECLDKKKLFEDPEFPANDSSLYYTKTPGKPIKWLRPGEIVKDPKLIAQAESRFEVVQGELGIFRFHFWRYGKWVEVIIDDRLPTYNGELIFLHSNSKNEFWSALVEKAYAKLFGSYEAIDGGMASEALEDFTGGLIELYGTQEKPPEQLMGLILKGFEKGSFFSCSIDADPYSREAQEANGLIRGHAYSITAIKQVKGPKGETVLVRIRNPWGDSHEWKGAWSDSSPEWNSLPQNEREQMQVRFLADGEFWMAFDDFIREFKKIEICHFNPEIFDELDEMTGVDLSAEEVWTSYEGDGVWSRKTGTAGGCRNYITTFANNPQHYAITVADGKNVGSDGKIQIISAVMQKYRREGRKNGLEDLTIGFGVYQVDGPKPTKKLDQTFFQTHRSIANTTFTNLREITLHFRAPPGTYAIIPSTFEQYQEGEFLIRIYSEGKLTAGELK
uniref:Galectin n=1 Tax=Acrobeloides nanus TaxID=290746 RepID=A0A914D6F2_9BILA